MKNREKYREEIVKSIKDRDSCEFMIKTVNPVYSDGWECNDELCQRDECEACLKLFAFWLDEEYEEPPKPEVDWSKVPVDTLVRVRDNEDDEWLLRYFDSLEDESFSSMAGHNYRVFADGATSVTGRDYFEYWKYCELAEDEDDGSN